MPEPVDLNFVTTDTMGGTWLQWADSFTDVKDLVDQAIAKLKPGQCIRRLVIAGHGADHTTGFFVFDPETAGVETIDGGFSKTPLGSPNIEAQLSRLRPYFCPDAIVEFRVCEAGTGDNGTVFVETMAGILGVPVTAPTDSISSLAAVGGVTTSWKTARPGPTGTTVEESFWRGDGNEPPLTPHDDGIAPITGATVPMRPVTAPPPATPVTTPASTATTGGSSRTLRVAIAGAVAVLVIGAALFFSSGDDEPTTTATDDSVASTTTAAASSTTAAPTTAAPAAAPNRPPEVLELSSTLTVPVTVYTVTASDPDGDALTYEWAMAGESCGSPTVPWTQAGETVAWSHHEDEGCSHLSTDHDVTVTVTITDGNGGSVQCTIGGSNTGTYDPATSCLR